MVRGLWLICVEEVLESKIFILSLVQTQRLIESNDGFLAKSGHDELEEWQWFPFKKIRLFHTDRLILSIFNDAVKSVIQGQILLLQDSDLGIENFDKLWLLLFEEVNLRIFAQLQGIYETRVFDEATTVKRLDLKRRRQAPPLTLLLFPVSVHVVEYELCIISHLDLLRRQEKILVSSIRK